MAITIEATYEAGILKPAHALPFEEHQKLWITVSPAHVQSANTVANAEEEVNRSYGMLGWKGDVETLRRIIEDPEFGLKGS